MAWVFRCPARLSNSPRSREPTRRCGKIGLERALHPRKSPSPQNSEHMRSGSCDETMSLRQRPLRGPCSVLCAASHTNSPTRLRFAP